MATVQESLSSDGGVDAVNPQWMQIIRGTMKEILKVCTHCKRVSSYPPKKIGKYYKCHFCGHKFKETGR
jgi:hypothetical protein